VRTLVNGPLPAGEHAATWNGRDDNGRMSAPGIYFFDLETGSGKLTGKALLLK
jgi:flagellar hook assembly protein FlgD